MALLCDLYQKAGLSLHAKALLRPMVPSTGRAGRELEQEPLRLLLLLILSTSWQEIYQPGSNALPNWTISWTKRAMRLEAPVAQHRVKQWQEDISTIICQSVTERKEQQSVYSIPLKKFQQDLWGDFGGKVKKKKNVIIRIIVMNAKIKSRFLQPTCNWILWVTFFTFCNFIFLI